VLVAEDADDLAADADGGVEQRADVTRRQIGLQVARPLVAGSVLDREDGGPADLFEVGGGVGASELEASIESFDALAIAELADDRGWEAKAPVAHAFDPEHVAVDPQDLLKSRLPFFTGQSVQMDERLGARVRRDLHCLNLEPFVGAGRELACGFASMPKQCSCVSRRAGRSGEIAKWLVRSLLKLNRQGRGHV
jgi:hypothetical protein